MSKACPFLIKYEGQSLEQKILDFWPNRDGNHFPAPLPVSIEKSDFKTIDKNNYLFSIKSNGTRFLLVVHDKNIYFVDRSLNFYFIQNNDISFLNKDKLFNQNDITSQNNLYYLMDGEFIKDKNNNYNYLIHDMICSEYINISTQTLIIRLQHIESFINKYFDQLNSALVTIKAKKFFNNINSIIKELDLQDHITDGIIMTPILSKIGTGSQSDLFKWKDIHDHTFDFKIIEEKGIITAYVYNNGSKKEIFNYSKEHDNDAFIYFKKALKKINFENEDIVECHYDKTLKTYIPKMIRKDKNYPNSLHTFNKTHINIHENIKLEDIITFFS